MALCGLGKSAPLPVISTLKTFRDEYEEHIRRKEMPCTKSVPPSDALLSIRNSVSVAASAARNCPAGAITGAK